MKVILILLLFIGNISQASDYFGRFSLSTYGATERFTEEEPTASNINDQMSGSGRFYLRVFDLGSEKWDIVTDLRDKYNAFDQLNKQTLELDSKNYFKAWQLYTSNLNSNHNLEFQVGRFSVVDAGGVYNDGLLTQFHFTRYFKVGIFGGLDPFILNTETPDFNSDSSITGVYATYEPETNSGTGNFLLTHSFVNKSYKGETDRSYLYQNIFYQSDSGTRLMSSIFVDFVPTTKMQTGSFLWGQNWNSYNSTRIRLLGIDVVEYYRRQDLRQKLDPSPYQQGTFEYEYNWKGKSGATLSYLKGQRSVDKLSKTETKLKLLQGDLLDKKMDTAVYGGTRNNFTSEDTFYGLSASYIRSKVEFSVDVEMATEKYIDKTLHSIYSDISASYIFNKQIFTSLSFESISDETVKIFGIFAKLSYRFGSKETAPLRDGSAPRGRL